MVFNGAGVCDGCAEAVGVVLEQMGLSVMYIKQGELTPARFSHAFLYVQPGGSDRLEDTLEVLAPAEIQALKDFVAHGGRYLGICAGAYLATTTALDVQGFGLLSFNSMEEETDPQPRIESIFWKNQLTQVYFQDGPYFDVDVLRSPKVEVWARYAGSGHVAALISSYGKGRVGVIGPHLEADASWYEQDHLPVPAKFHLDLLARFVRSLSVPRSFPSSGVSLTTRR